MNVHKADPASHLVDVEVCLRKDFRGDGQGAEHSPQQGEQWSHRLRGAGWGWWRRSRCLLLMTLYIVENGYTPPHPPGPIHRASTHPQNWAGAQTCEADVLQGSVKTCCYFEQLHKTKRKSRPTWQWWASGAFCGPDDTIKPICQQKQRRNTEAATQASNMALLTDSMWTLCQDLCCFGDVS